MEPHSNRLVTQLHGAPLEPLDLRVVTTTTQLHGPAQMEILVRTQLHGAPLMEPHSNRLDLWLVGTQLHSNLLELWVLLELEAKERAKEKAREKERAKERAKEKAKERAKAKA